VAGPMRPARLGALDVRGLDIEGIRAAQALPEGGEQALAARGAAGHRSLDLHVAFTLAPSVRSEGPLHVAGCKPSRWGRTRAGRD
jgi:hypothetical protein